MPRATAPFTALRASGRLMVMTAIPSLTSVRTGSDIGVNVLNVMAGALCRKGYLARAGSGHAAPARASDSRSSGPGERERAASAPLAVPVAGRDVALAGAGNPLEAIQVQRLPVIGDLTAAV